MRDLRIGAALAVTFASLLAASIAFAQQSPQQSAQLPAKQPPSNSLPPWVVLSELPDELTAEISYIRNLKVVLNESKVLLLDPAGRAVATVIDENSTDEIKK